MRWVIYIAALAVFAAGYKQHRHTQHKQLRPHNAQRNMFSGIVEEIGEIDEVSEQKQQLMWDGSYADGFELRIKAKKAVEEAYIGCSIAVNGVCLTATSYDEEKFTVGLSAETLRRTNLKLLCKGSKVNVERALKADGRNSGHFVQGHVDTTGKIIEKWEESDSLWVKVAVDSDVIKYIVPKGFIAVDGTSLTICDVHRSQDGSNWFTFMMVAHTQQNVIIPKKEIGELVNIEVDVLAKMVERSVAGTLERIERNSQSLQSLVTEKESLVRSLEATIEEHKLKFVEHDMTINNLLNRLDQLQQLINKNS